MWRYDANRTNASPQELPSHLYPQWVRHYPPLKPAWPDQNMMPFDAAYEPIVTGTTMYVGSSHADSVTAIDTRSGEEKWRFQAEGPVRFAPLFWEDRIYFVSDDSYLYCLDAAKGTLQWKFRGGPSERKILGNERLISTWPARGAPVIADGTIYFAASIWPFMGIFIHALDARTGSVIWTNDGDGSSYIKQPHNTESFAGVAPQGPMAVLGDKLLVSGGRSVPACYDRKTGKLIHFLLNENSKKGGGSTVAAIDRVFINGNGAFELATGKHLGVFPPLNVLTGDVIYGYQTGTLKAFDLGKAQIQVTATPSAKSSLIPEFKSKWTIPELASHKLAGANCMIKAGSRLYLGLPNKVLAVSLPLARDELHVEWEAEVNGVIASLIAADDRLFAVSLEGRIFCFGRDAVETRQHRFEIPHTPEDGWSKKAREILEATRVTEGYCICWGVGSGRLITELVRQSRLHVIAVDADPAKVKAARDSLISLGVYGDRAAVHLADPMEFEFPPYFAALMVSEDLHGITVNAAFTRRMFESLRPYGGVACLPLKANERVPIVRTVSNGELPKAVIKDSATGMLLIREGALPGAGNWTHEHADAANTRVSSDQIVKAPLGILWFGGPSHEGILPRHGHGPQPQAIDGRLIVEGVDKLRALDLYTGRLLWETALPGLGAYYNSLAHQPGANSGGTNFISTSDGIYVAYRNACVVLQPDTGKRIAEYHLPFDEGEPAQRWGYINVIGDYLVGGAVPIGDAVEAPAIEPAPKTDDDDPKTGKEPPKPKLTWRQFRAAVENSCSKRLVVMDRHTGKLVWKASARFMFRHNATCIGGGRIYTIDRPAPELARKLKLTKDAPPLQAQLVAFDLDTGAKLWNTDADVFGTFLSYSEKHDVLVETGRVTRDALPDEPRGMRAYSAATGKVLWLDKSLSGPAMVHGDFIIRDKGATSLLSGQPIKKPDPLTGELVEWTWTRNYGCNTPAAAEHLMTFRSGAAGYCDLWNDSGTGNFGGIRSGCTNNLVVAGGVISAPDYTRTCTCSYQNQTSLALVPMPDAEMWTSFGKRDWKGQVRRVGINFGAPGDRREEDGTLWLEFPSVGGASPIVDVKIKGGPIEYFRTHSSRVRSTLPWVAGSGVKGLESATITLGPPGATPRKYTVRLIFAEPDAAVSGERVFDVAIQGRIVLQNLDVAKETGGPWRGLAKEFTGIMAGETMEIALTPSSTNMKRRPIICGIEVLAEGW